VTRELDPVASATLRTRRATLSNSSLGLYGRIICLDPMLLNPLITNRNRRALGDEWRDGDEHERNVDPRPSLDRPPVSCVKEPQVEIKPSPVCS
jgi:hypothetical protein